MKRNLIISDVELTYKRKTALQLPLGRIQTSSDAVALCKDAFPENTLGVCERFGVLLLKGSRVFARAIVSVGGLNIVVVDPKIIFQYVWASGASSMILFHNHPSGAIKPSPQDVQLTKRIGEAATILDVELLDHIIIAPDTDAYFSFADEGLL